MEITKEIIHDFVLRGFKISSICEQLNTNKKIIQTFVIHPSRAEIAEYQIKFIKQHYSYNEIETAFIELKSAEDLQTKVNRLEYYTLGCAFGLYKTVFETLLGRERFGTISKEFRRKKTEQTVLERYGVRSVSCIPDVKEKKAKTRTLTLMASEQKKVQNKKSEVAVDEDIIEQVKDMALRGFKRKSIHERLNVSYPVLRSIGFCPSRDDIVEYQVQYIREYYSNDCIKAALKNIHEIENFQALANRHELFTLGCAFGSIAQPFTQLLGSVTYQEIVSGQIRKRQESSGVLEGAREKRRQTMLSLYGVEHPNQNEEIAKRMVTTMKETNQRLYGVDHPMKQPEVAKAANIKRQQTMLARYGAANSVQVPEIRERIIESRRRNGTLSTSFYEVEMKRLLIEQFGEDDVLQSVCLDDRYPYHVDFYIKSRDLFIELNTDPSHGRHWFDPESEADVLRLDYLKNQMGNANKPSRYRNNIRVWTERDPEKRDCARKHELNYLVFWDSASRNVNGKKIPLLRDFYEWIDAGCPDSINWDGHDENKY